MIIYNKTNYDDLKKKYVPLFLALRDVLYALFIHEAELTTVARYAEIACCSSFITGSKWILEMQGVERAPN